MTSRGMVGPAPFPPRDRRSLGSAAVSEPTDDVDEAGDETGDVAGDETGYGGVPTMVDRALGVEAEDLDEHGVARRFGISWAPPSPLVVAVASYVGATFGVAIVYSIVVTSFELTQGPSGAGASMGQVVGQLATGQPTEVTVGTIDLTLAMRALLQFCLWAPLAIPALVFAVKRGAGVKADLGLEVRGRDVPVGVAIGVAAQLLVPLLYLLLRPFIGTPDVSAEARELTDQATDVVGIGLLLLITVVFAPLVEEIYYRGLVLRAAERSYGPTVALIGSSVFFAMTHFQVLQFPALLLFGAVLAAIAMRTGRIGIPIVAHIAFNLTAVVLLLAFPDAPF